MYPPPAPPSARVYPIWMIIGPAITAVLATGLLSIDFGMFGQTVANDLMMPASAPLTGAVIWLVATVAGAGIGLAARKVPAVLGVAGGVIVFLGMLLMAFTPGLYIYFAAKAVTGFGAGLSWMVAFVIARTDEKQKATVTTLLAGLGLVSLVATPFVGGVITEIIGWRFVLYMCLPVLAAALIVSVVTAAIQPRANTVNTITPQ